MFKRLQRWTGGEAVEVDTQVLAGVVRPGDTFPGQVVLRAVGKDVQVETIVLRAVAEYLQLDTGEAEADEIGYQYLDGPFVVRKEQEHQVRFSMRLPWETPITELAGQALGPVVRLQTLLGDEDSQDGADHDLIHVSSLPLHEAIMDAFAAAGWTFHTSRLVGERVPVADQIFDFHQSFTLTDRGSAVGGPGDLEVAFLTNAVGSEVFVRPAAPESRYWNDKPPARRFIAAHHDLDRVDWPAEIRRWIGEAARWTG
ncbi:sporulation protein [Actinoallomurus sp. CA-150999]|uniref:sporulation protein n=1 Tax=Actinoallomurus sp. CA-150999 TaxID=3239887 RepID=UPI003D8FFD48